MTDTTTNDPYAEIAAMETTALTDFQAKLTQLQADLISIFASINPSSTIPNTPARSFYGRASGNVSMLMMDINTTLAGYTPPTPIVTPIVTTAPTT